MKKYVYFEDFGMSASGKTKVVHVKSMVNDLVLGEIRWFARWRKYTFQPVNETVFDGKCLNEITECLEYMTNEHKNKASN